MAMAPRPGAVESAYIVESCCLTCVLVSLAPRPESRVSGSFVGTNCLVEDPPKPGEVKCLKETVEIFDLEEIEQASLHHRLITSHVDWKTRRIHATERVSSIEA